MPIIFFEYTWPGALSLDPTGALKRAPGPHAAKFARVARFDFLHFVQTLLINGAPSHPFPTGTLEQSYATVLHEDSGKPILKRLKCTTKEN